MSAAESHILQVYSPPEQIFERGEGCWMWDDKGEKYLDCIAGISVNAFGHAPPFLVKTLTEQAGKLWHTSNMFKIKGQEELAAKYTRDSFADVVFFTNSGTEAIEGSLKTARKYHAANGNPERIDIIGFQGSFHGRSYAAINASGTPAYLEGFGPRLPGFIQIPYGDEAALRAAITPTTAALIIEPVQGEGGVRAVPEETLRLYRKLADENGFLIIFDEVQSGAGRTGKMWAHQWSGMTPDIMAVAKGVGGGFPMGAFMATKEAAKGMVVGVHGTTFGGNPLAMAVGNAAYDELSKPAFLEHVNKVANYLSQSLEGLKDRHPNLVVDVRGKGLLRGIKLTVNPKDIQAKLRARKVLVGVAGDNVLRIAPPLTIKEEELSQLIDAIDAVLAAQMAEAQRVSEGPRHFLDITALSREDVRAILDEAHARKAARIDWPKAAPDEDAPLDGYALAMIFQKNSTRTRVSFEIGMHQLGGKAIVLNANDTQLGRGETVEDTARVLSRMVDAVMIRANNHQDVVDFAAAATVPVINGLTDLSHPCQIFADLQTIEERLGDITGKTIAWLGDGNNVCTSFMHAAEKLDFKLRIATPATYAPRGQELAAAIAAGADIEAHNDAQKAVEGADVVVTDTWVSMGDTDKDERLAAFPPFAVNDEMMARAGKDAIFLHCLPAHRGEEVTDSVLDGERSAAWDEAENRIHAQKAVLLWCLGKL